MIVTTVLLCDTALGAFSHFLEVNWGNTRISGFATVAACPWSAATGDRNPIAKALSCDIGELLESCARDGMHAAQGTSDTLGAKWDESQPRMLARIRDQACNGGDFVVAVGGAGDNHGASFVKLSARGDVFDGPQDLTVVGAGERAVHRSRTGLDVNNEAVGDVAQIRPGFLGYESVGVDEARE